MEPFRTSLNNKEVHVSDAERPWMKRVRFKYDKDLIKKLKQYPGPQWSPEDKAWVVPDELIPWLCDLSIEQESQFRKQPNSVVAPPPLHAYQASDAAIAAGEPAYIWGYEMGLGKTASSITALQMRNVKAAVIVCPAMARGVWERELYQWWPNHPEVEALTTGKAVAASTAPIRIVSYALLNELKFDTPPEAFIFDELHYLANSRSRRSRIARDITERYPQAFRGGLTGTIFTNDPTSGWNPLDTIYPGRVGTYFKWSKRYTDAYHNGYGWEFKGINEKHARELKYRITAMVSRVTKAEVAHLLPDFTPQLVYLDEGQDRLKAAKDLIESAVAEGTPHVVGFTWQVNSAKKLAKMLKLPRAVTGDIPPHKRDKLLEELKAGRITVATIASTKEAIDLTHAAVAVYAELTYDLLPIVQSLGRLHRLSGTQNVTVKILADPADDEVAQSLQRKIQGLNAVLKLGVSGGAVRESLGALVQEELTEDEWDEVLAAASESFTGLEGTEELL